MQNLSYNYQKLETPSSFRLLQIERSPDDTNDSCYYSLIHTTFDQAPPYETLSYVWGTPDRSEMLILRNHKFLRITKLLKEALAFVEKQCSTGYLWIDQICIDQDDMIERGDQVKLMGQIYTSCSRVLVWLGRMTRFDSQVFVTDELEESQPSKMISVPEDTTMKHFIHRLRKMSGTRKSSIESSWLEILQSPWFQRAWVFQEVVLPLSALFILGTRTALLDQAFNTSLLELHSTIVKFQAKGISGPSAVVDTMRIMYRRCSEQRQKADHSPPPIEQTLSILAPRAKTSEELDRLYAFFGLNFDTCINLKPSYNSSLEIAMIDTAVSIIEGTCSLDLFEVIPRAVEYTIKNVGIPTWTPDFREEHLVVPFKRSNVDFRQLAKLHPDRFPLFIPTHITYYRGTIYCAGEEKRTIQAHGFVLDQVDTEIGSLSSKTTSEAPLNALLKRCIKAWNKIKLCAEQKSSSTSKHKRKYTGLAEFTADLGFAPMPDGDRLRQVLVAEGCCAPSYERAPAGQFDSLENAASTEQTIMQVMRGRTLWMTRSGRLALGSYLRGGDHICLVYGCSNPIALRGAHDMTKVLGTCFLEGWMDPWSNGGITRGERDFSCTVFHII